MELLVWRTHLYERLTYVKKMQVFILLTTNIFILCQMLSVVSESRLIFLVHATTTQKKKIFWFCEEKLQKRLEGFLKKKNILFFIGLFLKYRKEALQYLQTWQLVWEKERERVSFSLLEREDHVRSVCMFVSLCVCVSYVIMLIRKKVWWNMLLNYQEWIHYSKEWSWNQQ